MQHGTCLRLFSWQWHIAAAYWPEQCHVVAMRRRIEAERRSRPRSASGIGSAEPVATDRAAWTAARWVCLLHPCAATASRSRWTTPREAPSDEPAWAQYESEKIARG